VQKGLESLAFIFALPHGDPLYEEFENPNPITYYRIQKADFEAI